jgi:D-alanyl-lipoteichoic acid acyltransferase DltB (MBOAT superfamily)
VFFFLGRGGRSGLAIPWLVAASLFFYGWWNPVYLLLILASIFFNYSVGRYLSRPAGSGRGAGRRAALVLGVSANLGALAWFKYANFLLENINFTLGSQLPGGIIVLPLAISFFTFQQIAYLADAYQGRTHEYSFLHYTLFVTFFPQLIAGPIVHHREMLPQFRAAATYVLRPENLAIGGTIFTLGLFKKVVLADNLALLASPAFAAAERGAQLNWSESWQAVGAYTLQLYFDFSGYSDMAIGLGRLFGIKIPLNFNSPYRAANIIDFWRWWHMTLSRFLRDYLYIPLGGNRHGRIRRYRNLMIAMVLGGLWHGAGWTFVVWGTLHGVYLCLNHLWHRVGPGPVGRWWSLMLARVVTLAAVMLGWIFFRAETFTGAGRILAGFTHFPAAGPTRNDLQLVLASAVALAALWMLPNVHEMLRHHAPAHDYPRTGSEGAPLSRLHASFLWKPSPAWAVVTGAAAAAAILSLTRVSEFLYFQF